MRCVSISSLFLFGLLTACSSVEANGDTDAATEGDTPEDTDASGPDDPVPSGSGSSDAGPGGSGTTESESTDSNPTNSGPTDSDDTTDETDSDTDDSGPGCEPRCEGSESVLCNDDGDEVRFDCSEVELGCDGETGRCEGPCAPHELDALTGCGFTAVTARNDSGSTAWLSVTAGATAAEVTVDANETTTLELGPGESALVEVADNDALSGEGSSLVAGAAYEINATAPIRVVQWVPLSNDSMDSSTLLAHHAWGHEHRVVSYPDWGYEPGFMAVVARRDGTTVTFEGSAEIGVAEGTDIDGNGNGSVVLDTGDVLQLISAADADLSGLGVSSDEPVQVIGGHGCTAIEYSYCDHLEEVMPPFERLGTEYVVGLPPSQEGELGELMLRIVATEANTSVTVGGGTPGDVSLSEPGAFADVVIDGSIAVVSASAPVVVGEMMLSPRKPSLSVAWPEHGWMAEELNFAAPDLPSEDYVQAICPEGSTFSLDGSTVQPIDSAQGYALYLELVSPGAHVAASGDAACTIAQAGYRSYASYFNRLR